MTRIASIITFLGLGICSPLSAQAPQDPPPQSSLPQRIGEIAEMETPSAWDYEEIAQGTLSLGQQSLQSGQPLPKPTIHDALDAVEAGRVIDKEAANWDELKQGLEALLEPPPQQQQQDQQSQQDSENQDQSSQEQPQGSSGESSQENQDQEPQEQSSDSQQQSQEQQGQQQDGAQEQQSQQNSQGDASEQQGDNQQSPQKMPNQDGAQVGKLDEQPQEMELSQSNQPPEEMQTLGGQNSNEPAVTAEKAALMQMLEQLRQQDEPGKLFQILQDAQTGEQTQPQPNTKDW